MFYFEPKLLDYKKFSQNRKLYMHEVHMKRSTHLQPRLVKPLGTLINAIAGQNDTFSLPLPLPRVLTLCLEVFFNKVSIAKGRGGPQKKALTTTFSSF